MVVFAEASIYFQPLKGTGRHHSHDTVVVLKTMASFVVLHPLVLLICAQIQKHKNCICITISHLNWYGKNWPLYFTMYTFKVHLLCVAELFWQLPSNRLTKAIARPCLVVNKATSGRLILFTVFETYYPETITNQFTSHQRGFLALIMQRKSYLLACLSVLSYTAG